MNRFKFRAWDNKNKEWLLGYELENLGGFSLFGECVMMGEWERAAYPFVMRKDDRKFNDLKVMQFTGLKDKNGTEIYEGDIVLCEPSDMFRSPYSAEVKMSEHGYWTPLVRVREGYNQIAKYSPEAFEVIGNIYENPELLKQEAK